jgi:cellulose synthase (UDP-forming)
MDFRLLLVALSVAASARYLYWRIFHSLATFTWFEIVFSAVVLLAEIYGIAILFLGYFQTFRLKERQSIPLPADKQLWPTVDVLVVTYDEQVKVLRRTLIGCLKMDYPADKKRIYLLDDGRRQEMRDLADELGCHYIVRPDNKHAKAGNLNNALRQTDGEIVAIFDADQIPVKTFLTETVGFMLADPKCALVQTPQHAFTTSPFEHNLGLTGKIASEDAFFYRVAQVGNDYWNSAYFCGCCAILRRTSLKKICGIAVETVGEDAHTSMRLHAAGFNSVYYSKPLAAGQATARFGEYLSQRLRWGRGMTQIFRIENPLFIRGLSLPQRINYFLAIVHFFGGLPRLALIAAPLAYLLVGWRPLNCNNWDILFYAGPHIFFALGRDVVDEQEPSAKFLVRSFSIGNSNLSDSRNISGIDQSSLWKIYGYL